MEPLTRRSMVLVSIGAVATLPGCSETTSSPTEANRESATATRTTEPTSTRTETLPEPTSTPTTNPASLSLEYVRFCAEQPSGYRKFVTQPEHTYDPGDVVWVYFEPSTVGTEPAGEGERRFAFDLTWTVYGPDGEAMETITDTIDRTVVDSGALSEVFLVVNFSPSTPFDPGRHRMEITARDTLADTEATTTAEFMVAPALQEGAGPFEVTEITFTDGRPNGDPTPKPGAEYGPTETVSYYYEIGGMHYERTADAIVTDLSVVERVTGPDGDVLNVADIPLENEYAPDIDEPVISVADSLEPNEWELGSYTIRLTVTDGYTGDRTEQTGSFTIVE